ncbi:MAG: DUF222 domain-containing protein, partial [Deltaproteobacteria bacterium]|nr:DUF222 domain-containing protein [Deltaproteobacteria bacterium]
MFETVATMPSVTVDLEALDSKIATLASQLDAGKHRFLMLIGEYDSHQGWGNGGFRSCAHYLNWRVGLTLGAGREHVRVARALPELPKISEALRCGQLSYSKARAMTRVATPENEEYLLTMALAATASQVEKIARGLRRTRDAGAANDEAEAQHEARMLDFRTEEDGSLRIEGRLPPELGAELKRALEQAMHALAEGVPAETHVP